MKMYQIFEGENAKLVSIKMESVVKKKSLVLSGLFHIGSGRRRQGEPTGKAAQVAVRQRSLCGDALCHAQRIRPFGRCIRLSVGFF